ncbi:serine/arginine-rich splicing factor 4-like [Mizuhopecten yessoensis]|uniref:serine/arginine-rich splicing factor 4-like n=1 Tax=Mizuhopecten yessoensis TaxID=6573 RepID=UPI000B45A0F9|nr:serine/arginine-rich splicing factor 4-like [Mizuhopecten yessoensis]
MNYDLDLLSMSKRQATEDDHQLYKPSAEMCKWQVEMADILKSQKQKGGIIDLEAEKIKFLVTAEDTVKLPWQVTSSELDNLAKSSTNSKESRQAVDIKPITVEGKSRSAGLHGSNRERTNRQDHPRPSSGHTDRHQRYRGHRNYGRDGHRSNDGRNRGGHKVNRSYHTGQVDERERKADYDKEKRSGGRSVKTDATRSDRTDVSSGNVSPQHKEHKAVNERCETASKTEIESQFRTVNRGSVADDDPKKNKTNGDKSAITKDIEQDSAGQGQEDRDKSSNISPKESVEKQTERVSIDSDKSFQRKGFPASGGKISARSSNKTNYRGSESKNSEYENRNYYKGKNDDREREHSSRGRGQGRTERGHGRGSRRSANQEAVKSKPELEKNNTDPQEKGKVSKELGFQRPNSGYKGRNQGFGRPSNRTQYHYDSYSKHGKSERREVSSKNDKGEVNGKFDIKGVNGKSNSGQVSYDHTRTRQVESASTNKSSIKPGGRHNSETQNSTSDNFGAISETYDDRFVQDHKHWNKDKETGVCKGRSDTNKKEAVITGKERTSQPSCGVKRPPGFTLVQKMNNDVKIPPGFEKSGISV